MTPPTISDERCDELWRAVEDSMPGASSGGRPMYRALIRAGWTDRDAQPVAAVPREPTPEMQIAGREAYYRNPSTIPFEQRATECWRAMYDAFTAKGQAGAEGECS